MEEYFKSIGKTEESLTKFFQIVTKLVDTRSRLAFTNGCGELVKLNIANTTKEISEREERISKCTLLITQSARDMILLQKRLTVLTGTSEEVTTWANSEYDALRLITDVKSVVVSGKVISIYTNRIDIHTDTNLCPYHIGEFRIDIHTDGSEGGVRIYNLTNVHDGYQHPHINYGGYCCFGNISSGVAKLLAEYQYVVLAQLLMSYLKSYVPYGAYIRIENWG